MGTEFINIQWRKAC